MSKGRDEERAYLLITFDLQNQRMLSTEEVAGPFEGEHHNVRVDWPRLIGTIKRNTPDPPPKDPPWKRATIDDDDYPPKDPPWNRAAVDDTETEGEERPPEV